MNAASTLRSRLRLLREQGAAMTCSGSLASSTARSILSAAAPLTRGRASRVPRCSTLRSVACVVSCSRSTRMNTSTNLRRVTLSQGQQWRQSLQYGNGTGSGDSFPSPNASGIGSGAHLGLLPHSSIVPAGSAFCNSAPATSVSQPTVACTVQERLGLRCRPAARSAPLSP